MTTRINRNKSGNYDVSIDGEFIGKVGKPGDRTVSLKEVDRLGGKYTSKRRRERRDPQGRLALGIG